MVLSVYLMFRAFSWSLDSSPGNLHGIDKLFDLEQEFASSYIVNIFGFVDRMVSIAATQFCHWTTKAGIDSM